MNAPRIMIAGLRGSGGKSFVAVGLAAAWTRSGQKVAPFKKGMDYIDAAWLRFATGRPCRNLDLFMVESDAVRRSFAKGAANSDVALIEGNRGLFDGMNVRGSYSSAELAKLLRVPVVLVCDATKATRTVGAMILGCQKLDPDLDIKGVVLNRVAGQRHEAILREVVDEYCGLPVLGVIPKLPTDPFPERHLGLVPPEEHGGTHSAVETVAEVAAAHLDLAALLAVARSAPEISVLAEEPEDRRRAPVRTRARIGVFRDQAFQFYYTANLEALERAGGELVEISPIRERTLPPVDAIYMGGGFPETCAAQLADNRGFRRAVAAAVEDGMPVYAECGGAVYLGRSLVMGENTYPMAGALPVDFGFGKKPQGHGYTVMEVTGPNPYYQVGQTFRGHEFHYTRVIGIDEDDISFAFRVKRGYGVDGERDGICRRNTLATYCHVHALGVTTWAESIVRAATAR